MMRVGRYRGCSLASLEFGCLVASLNPPCPLCASVRQISFFNSASRFKASSGVKPIQIDFAQFLEHRLRKRREDRQLRRRSGARLRRRCAVSLLLGAFVFGQHFARPLHTSFGNPASFATSIP